MDDNVLKKFLNKMDYKTYKSIQKKFDICSIFFDALCILNYPFLLEFLIFLSVSILSRIVKAENYTSDMLEMKKLYSQFIKEYNELNDLFELNNPVEIYTMYNYLLYNGYLSKNKTFYFENVDNDEILELMGLNVISGKGVCRNITSLLNDILNSNGILSNTLSVYLKNYYLDISPGNNNKKTIEELMNSVKETNFFTNKDDIKAIEQELIKKFKKYNGNIDVSLKFIDSKRFNEILFGNHAITYAIKDNKNYFLDATNFKMYRLRNDKKLILSDDSIDLPIKLFFSKTYNIGAGSLKINKNLLINNLSISREEEENLKNNTLKVCSNNLDVFDKFYNNNKELYNEMSYKLLKMTKR